MDTICYCVCQLLDDANHSQLLTWHSTWGGIVGPIWYNILLLDMHSVLPVMVRNIDYVEGHMRNFLLFETATTAANAKKGHSLFSFVYLFILHCCTPDMACRPGRRGWRWERGREDPRRSRLPGPLATLTLWTQACCHHHHPPQRSSLLIKTHKKEVG